jgi:DNA-binding transcriptional LysR family regulator
MMESLANLEAFARSAEASSFSGAARRLSITPAAVSRNVAMLERNLGIRLFHRSTRKLTLTEAGESFLAGIGDSLEALQHAIAGASQAGGDPAGSLKVSMSLSFGLEYVLPILPAFLERYPAVRPDWHFGSRRVDLVAEGFDAAIGGGFDYARTRACDRSRGPGISHGTGATGPARRPGRSRRDSHAFRHLRPDPSLDDAGRPRT